MSKQDIKKMIIIAVIIIIIGSIGFLAVRIFQKNQNNKPTDNIVEVQNYKIVLLGSTEITLYENDEYEEFGYYALLNDDEIVTEQVEVTNEVDTKNSGDYLVTYKIGNETKIRNVKVLDNPNNDVEDIKLELVGNETIEIYVGDTYVDSGCQAYDKENNNISNKIVTDNRVNTKIAGTYKVIYSIFENDKWKNVQRTVIVKEKPIIEKLNIEISYDDSLTNKDLVVQIKANGTNFAYILTPDGNQIANKETTYNISQNGTYYFSAYDTEGNYETKNITINNIDKTAPTATCQATSLAGKTDIVVTANDNSGIKNYIYNINGSEESSELATYTANEKLDNVIVSVVDKAENQENITCSIENKTLEMHFIAGVSDDDAILIRTNDKVIMIDGGRYQARTKIVNYLKDLGITKIDALIGSHVHWNHVQAQAAILENFEVDKIYYSVDIMNCVSKKQCKSDDVKYIKNKIKTKGYTPIKLAAKDYLEIGDMKLYFIGPNSKLTTYENANSLVFILQFGNNKFMLTGDTPGDRMSASKFKTNAKALGLEDISIDVLKWPHHGYENLSDSFFKATKPKYAIIPNCCYCSSKYPSSHNKTLMKKYGIKYYQVCSGKNIVLTSDGENIDIKTKQKAADYAR